MTVLIILKVFARNLLRRNHRRNIFFYFGMMSGLGLELYNTLPRPWRLRNLIKRKQYYFTLTVSINHLNYRIRYHLLYFRLNLNCLYQKCYSYFSSCLKIDIFGSDIKIILSTGSLLVDSQLIFLR